MCVGYSMYNETRLRDRQRKGKGTEDVELPYCEGLEVSHRRPFHARLAVEKLQPTFQTR